VRAATFITARMGSVRLPRKPLLGINGKTVLELIVSRQRLARRPELLVLCTTTEPDDDELEAAARDLGVNVFRGERDDILLRWLHAADEYGVDLIVNCDCDDVFCDPPTVDRVIACHELTGADHIICEGFPFGAAPLGVTREGLRRVCVEKTTTDTAGQSRFFAKLKSAQVFAPLEVRLHTARLTLDYPEDLAFFRAVFEELGSTRNYATLAQIVAVLKTRPDLVAINCGMQAEYWRRFDALYPVVM